MGALLSAVGYQVVNCQEFLRSEPAHNKLSLFAYLLRHFQPSVEWTIKGLTMRYFTYISLSGYSVFIAFALVCDQPGFHSIKNDIQCNY
jgi:hypothetical protein